MRALLGVQRLASLRPGLAPRQQLRFMGAPKGGGGYGHGEYRGLKVPPVADYHKNVATIWGCMMWLWIFWRVKNDGKALIGLEHPWEHGHGHGHDDHGHGDHGHGDGEHGHGDSHDH